MFGVVEVLRGRFSKGLKGQGMSRAFVRKEVWGLGGFRRLQEAEAACHVRLWVSEGSGVRGAWGSICAFDKVRE